LKAECSQEPGNANANANADTVVTRDAKGQFVCGGLTGIVELLDNGTIIKSPFPGSEIEEHIRDIAIEASVYRRLGRHKRLVGLVSHSRDGLVLEYMEKGDLKVYLEAHNSSPIPMSLKLKWAYQAAEAVKLLHDHSIIHCDIKPRNFLLDAALDLKIIDFSGSSINGSKPTSGEGTRFYLPRHWRQPPTIATDLFALGSTLYEIFQGSSPYKEIPSDEVERLFKAKKFPSVSAIPCGQIIKQCWLSQVESAQQVRGFIDNMIRDELNVDYTPHLDGLDIDRDTSIVQVGSP
jgi:serine/threonine protein kinase